MQRVALEPNSFTFLALVAACRCRPAAHWRKGKAAMAAMARAGMRPEDDPVMRDEFRRVCLSAMNQCNLDESLEVFTALRQYQLHDTLECYTALLKACARHEYTPPAVVEHLQGARTLTLLEPLAPVKAALKLSSPLQTRGHRPNPSIHDLTQALLAEYRRPSIAVWVHLPIGGLCFSP